MGSQRETERTIIEFISIMGNKLLLLKAIAENITYLLIFVNKNSIELMKKGYLLFRIMPFDFR